MLFLPYCPCSPFTPKHHYQYFANFIQMKLFISFLISSHNLFNVCYKHQQNVLMALNTLILDHCVHPLHANVGDKIRGNFHILHLNIDN